MATQAINLGEDASICTLIEPNRNFYHIHQGQRCFILATGPSISEQDLAPLRNEMCIAVSQFYLHKDIRTIAPRYHVIAPWHPPFDFVIVKKIFDDFLHYYKNMAVSYFFGYRDYAYSVIRFFQQFPTYYSDNMHFMHYNGIGLEEKNFENPELWDLCEPLFETRTVIYSAIQLAFYLGFSEIYLLGCDHDYLKDFKRVTNHHFYDEGAGVSDREHLGSFSTEKWFKEYYDRWRHYRLMHTYLKEHGCVIYNATKGGLLDVFPRVSLESLF